jgi:DNA-binding MurR/RpiR family transcriptional regulator
MQKLNTLTKIKSLYPEITVAEKAIADFILNKPEEIYRLTIKDIASRTNVSLPTVFRFARRLGFDGFKDFKVALIRDIGLGLYFSPEEVSDESVEGITASVFENEINGLKETLANIDYKAVDETVNAILQADRLIFFAVSSSIPIAFDFNWKFCLAGFSCFQSSDVFTQEMVSKTSKKREVALGISFSGGTREVVRCMENARKNGTTTICVTSFINSPITAHSDIKLVTAPVQTMYQKIDLPSRIAMIAMLDVVYVSTVLKDPHKLSRNISKAEEALLSHRVKK